MMGRIVDENGFPVDGDWEEPETEHDEWLEEDFEEQEESSLRNDVIVAIAELFDDLSKKFYELAGYENE